MANIKDFATAQVANNPGTSGTTVTVSTGLGSRFPAVPFSATVHPIAELPTIDNSERVEVTARSGDDFTVTRATGDATAKDIQSGWRISNTIFVDNFDEKASASDLTSHTSNTSNPHSVTKSQVGLGNVDNTSDADKPVSTAQQTALNIKADSAHTHPVTDLTAVGRTSTTFLRGDNTWSWPMDTTYSEIAESEIDAGTSGTLRTISGRRAKYIGDGAVAAANSYTDSGLSTKANDSAVVHLAGTETITGNKDFTGALTKDSNTVVTTSNTGSTGDVLSRTSTGAEWGYKTTPWTRVSWESGFTDYGTTQLVSYRRVGNMVTVAGAAKPSGGSTGTMFILPTGFKPDTPDSDAGLYFLRQGSGGATVNYQILHSGSFTLNRYSNGTLGTNSWLPFFVTFVTVDSFPS